MRLSSPLASACSLPLGLIQINPPKMGCNESKQNAVATGNTTLRRKQSDNGSSKNSKDIKTVQETAINSNDTNNNNNVARLKLQQQPPAESHDDDVPVPVKDMVNENSEALKDDPKEIDEGNNQGVNNNNNGGDHNGEDRLVSRDSPHHFYSSRKDQEELGIDGIISEGRSGKSEYCTPRHGAGHHKPINLLAEDHDDGNNNNNALLEKKPLQNVPAKDAEEENGNV